MNQYLKSFFKGFISALEWTVNPVSRLQLFTAVLMYALCAGVLFGASNYLLSSAFILQCISVFLAYADNNVEKKSKIFPLIGIILCTISMVLAILSAVF